MWSQGFRDKAVLKSYGEDRNWFGEMRSLQMRGLDKSRVIKIIEEKGNTEAREMGVPETTMWRINLLIRVMGIKENQWVCIRSYAGLQ